MTSTAATKQTTTTTITLQASPPTTILHHLATLHNFTRTDIKTIVIPQTLFGVFSALSGPPLTTANPSPSSLAVFSRIPLILLWTWLNLLVFTLANQRLPSSVLEDALNKPWRNIPSGRVSPHQARSWLLRAVLAAWLLSALLGCWAEFAALAVLTWVYNDLGGANNEHFLFRNVNNALGYVFFGLGALRIATATDGWSGLTKGPGTWDGTATAYVWTGMLGGVVASSIQVQDLQDQEGDRASGRQTLPLVVGDSACRRSVAAVVAAWSVACPAFWELQVAGFVSTLTLGGLVIGRVLCFRNPVADEKTFAAWCAWLALLYLLPLLKSCEERKLVLC